MAIVNNGTRVSVPAAQIPTGYTKPTITAVSGDELWINQTSINILKSAVENANEVTAFTALVSAINVAAAALVSVAFTTTFRKLPSATHSCHSGRPEQEELQAVFLPFTVFLRVWCFLCPYLSHHTSKFLLSGDRHFQTKWS